MFYVTLVLTEFLYAYLYLQVLLSI